MNTKELESTARLLVAEGKGILAADESSGTIEKRLKSIEVPSTEENRRAYRELLFTAPELGRYISGVILFDETIRQRTHEGTSFVEVLHAQGIIPGIKVDKGAKAMPNFPGEKITEGLDGLRARFEEYHDLGARFSKWRAIITIGDGFPTDACIKANAQALARFAALSQEAGLVPIVEPEVLMDGKHSIERCEVETERTLREVFNTLAGQRVAFECMLLKPNMVVPGKDCPRQAAPHEIALATMRCMRRMVPAAVPGIVFLSGGQSELEATQNLNAINQIGPHPWHVSFSFGRALQSSALKSWAGYLRNFEAAQEALLRRARANSAAQIGNYSKELESQPMPLHRADLTI